MMRAGLALSMLVLFAGPAASQIPDLPSIGPSWVAVSYPKLFWTKRAGFTFGWFHGQIRPMGYEDWDDPQPYRGALTLDGMVTTEGRWEIEMDFRFPSMISGWRGALTLSAERNPREYYFGLGNSSTYSDDSVTSSQPRFYDSDTRRLFVRAEVQRRIAGPLRALAGFHLERWRLKPPTGPSVLARDLAAGVDPTLGRDIDDMSVRVGLVLDTRDNEAAPSRGVLLEAIVGRAASTVAGDASYTRVTGSAAGYMPVTPRLVLAARLLGQSMSEAAGAGSYFLIEQSERPTKGIGGATSHRGVHDLRYLGPDKLLANVDVRFDLMGAQSPLVATLLGFVDAGRVFGAQQFELTTDDLHVGGGGGLFLRYGRAAVLGVTLAHGPDGLVFQFATGWAY